MSGKGKQQQRQQGRREVSPVTPPLVQVQPEQVAVATTLAFTEPMSAEPSAVAAAPIEPAPGQPVALESPKPCRRGHVRAKVLVHGLVATGFDSGGEQRKRWLKDAVGEFPRESVDGIYLEAL
jgi:hypothetical protein